MDYKFAFCYITKVMVYMFRTKVMRKRLDPVKTKCKRLLICILPLEIVSMTRIVTPQPCFCKSGLEQVLLTKVCK